MLGYNENMAEIKKFYQMDMIERRELLKAESGLTSDEMDALCGDPGLSEAAADVMIENVIGCYALPLGIARNFLINGRDVLIPMVIEEPSVVAAASNGARIARAGGGFTASADVPCMIGQLQILGVEDPNRAKSALETEKTKLLAMAAESCPRLILRGGGPVDMEFRILEKTEAGPMLVAHLIMDVRDVMGANLIDTALEKLAPAVEDISGGTVRLRILSNLSDRRLARSSCSIPADALAFKEFPGAEVRDRILEAAALAEADPYRAVTHNKGIMNGIDAVVLATGNDWRAVEAGAHAWALYGQNIGRLNDHVSFSEGYLTEIRPLSHWRKDTDSGNLMGSIELPMAVGIFGGATQAHPGAAAALKLMGVKSSQELAGIIAAVGLAQNLAALKALSTEGIQRGHMRLHGRKKEALHAA